MAHLTCRWFLGAALASLALLPACNREGSRSFAAPSAVGAPTWLMLEGPANVPAGTVAAFTAFVQRPGEMRADVTRSAIWATGDARVATVDAAGQVSAVSIGEVFIEARYEGLVAGRVVRTLPAGTFIVSGTLAPAPGPARATVSVSGGVGPAQSVDAASSGAYRLAGVGGRVRLTASIDGFAPQSIERDVSTDLQQHFTFSLNPDGAGWMVAIIPGAACESVDGIGRAPLQSEVHFATTNRFAFLTPVAQPSVTFQGTLAGDVLSMLLAGEEDLMDYYFPGLLMRSASDARHREALMRVTLQREGAGYLGRGQGYVGLVGDGAAGENHWARQCDGVDHQVSFTPR